MADSAEVEPLARQVESIRLDDVQEDRASCSSGRIESETDGKVSACMQLAGMDDILDALREVCSFAVSLFLFLTLCYYSIFLALHLNMAFYQLHRAIHDCVHIICTHFTSASRLFHSSFVSYFSMRKSLTKSRQLL